MSRRYETHWVIDKKLPVALLVALSLQTGGIVWWASAISERVNNLEKQSTLSAPQADRLTRVEVKIESIEQGVQRIERAISKDK